MADVEMVIKIPEELLSEIDDENYQSIISWYDTTLYCAIKNGIPLPKHGRLIDADALINKSWDAHTRIGYIKVVDAVDVNNAPTIIEADKVEISVLQLNRVIKALEQERSRSVEITQYRHDCEKLMEENERLKKALVQEPKTDVLDKIRAELIQSIQNGTIKIESGNEELFRIIDKYKEESEDKE